MDITEAYEGYKNAVSDLNEAMAMMHISAEGLPAYSIQSVMENFQTRQGTLVSGSENIRQSLRSMADEVKMLASDIREATGSMVFMGMAADNHPIQPMQPDAGVRGEADVMGEGNITAPQALISSDLNKAPSEDADQEDNVAEPEEREENNMADSEGSTTADPRMSAMHID